MDINQSTMIKYALLLTNFSSQWDSDSTLNRVRNLLVNVNFHIRSDCRNEWPGDRTSAILDEYKNEENRSSIDWESSREILRVLVLSFFLFCLLYIIFFFLQEGMETVRIVIVNLTIWWCIQCLCEFHHYYF